MNTTFVSYIAERTAQIKEAVDKIFCSEHAKKIEEAGKTAWKQLSCLLYITDKIPNKYKQNGQCDSFAEQLTEQLEG